MIQMKNQAHKCCVLFLLSFALLVFLTACSAAEPPQDSAGDTAAGQESTGSHAASKQDLTLKDDGTGYYAQEISVGECSALAAVSFHYDAEPLAITSVDGVQVEALTGWQSVTPDAEINMEQLSYNTEKTRVSIPFTYFARIGVGTEAYTDSVTIDLHAAEQ